MTTKILTGTYSAGYGLQAPITTLSVAASGYVGGSGVATSATAISTYTVINDGRIVGSDGPGLAGVFLADGGEVTNGGPTDTAATIAGYRGVNIDGGRASVTNYGTIDGLARSAVRLGEGGVITNGARHDTQALIESQTGLAAISIDRHGQVHNFGTIDLGVQFIYQAGGMVTNGAVGSGAASIISDGATGVYFVHGAGRVRNFGLIQVANGPGVFLGGGGRITNGDANDPTATIAGTVGVDLRASGAVVNFGSIEGGGGAQDFGVLLAAGGKLTNGAADDTAAVISGYDGVYLGALGKVVNFGTIDATGGRTQRPAGGAAAQPGVGVFLTGGGGFSSFRNGAADDRAAVVEGYLGVAGSGGYEVVDNFGTIIGTSGIALKFTGQRNTLVVEGGCVFEGAVEGAGGTLELGSGTGTVRGLDGGGVLTVSDTISGAVTTQRFDDFGSLLVDRGAHVSSLHTTGNPRNQTIASDGGSITLGARATTLVNAGEIGTLLLGPEIIGAPRVTIKGALTNTGALVVEGGLVSVEGAATSTGAIDDLLGEIAFHSTFTGDVLFQSGSTLYLADSQSYSGTLNDDEYEFTDTLDLADIGFVGSGEATFSGNTLTVTDGVHTAHFRLGEQFIAEAVTFVASGDGHGGTIVTATGHHPAASVHAFVAAMANLAPARVAALHVGTPDALHALALCAPRAALA